ncbi:hypothetical protein R1sor_016457 [Riccia sorocarpa]|uniref:Fe-containing alcohol dehydrogenase-like C-terminal domain-containing protein n=1 Tax=Riccia sorocarpa TaxID=122646 RepID=A0ABD3HFG3_9MARC
MAAVASHIACCVPSVCVSSGSLKATPTYGSAEIRIPGVALKFSRLTDCSGQKSRPASSLRIRAVQTSKPEVGMPKSLTAATGMDALTHAIEAFVSTISNPVTDASALHALKLVTTYLRDAVNDGTNLKARDMMAYAQFLAGMDFNSASLGYVHAMAHHRNSVKLLLPSLRVAH